MRTPSRRSKDPTNDSSVSFVGNLEEDDDNDEFIEIGGIRIPPPPLPALTFDPTGPRLFIHKIVIENFKSYGGKTTLGPFHKNFAAIIGPNGSGKSNVIDAMLFVFGYRAQKIRSKTVGVLIHNSDAFPNCRSCSVAVHFEKILDRGRDEYDLVPGSQFVVSRVAHKDNSSFYAIDDRRVQFKEVSRILRSHGIDLDHNRFLILQGEVEQISLMKPIASNVHETGMLEFLEDLIGTGRLKEPIGQLQIRVDELNERRSEKLGRVKTAEADKNELEGLKNEALDYIKLNNEIAIKKHLHTQILIHQRNHKLELAEKELQQIQQANSEFIDDYKAKEKDIKDFEENLTQANKKHQQIEKKCEENRAKFTQLELEDVSMREDFRHSKDKIKKCQANLEKEKAKAEELRGAPDKLTKEIEELEEAKGAASARKEAAEANLAKVTSGLKEETTEIQAEKEKHEKVLFDEQTVVNNLKSKVDIACSELDLYTNEEETEKTKWESMKINLQSVEANLETRKSDLKNVKQLVPKLEQQLEASKADLMEVNSAEPKVGEKFRQLRNKLEDCRNQMQNQSSRNRLVGALMKEKSEGRIPGIIGRLGDLGGIDAKYDVAASTACPQLDNIVTDTLDSAIQCVNFLKSNNLGQATFIGLDKMGEWKQYVGKRIETPRNVPRLFDLLKVKDKNMLPAFYFVMRDTLVAENIEMATQIGLGGAKRYRVVTLKGELVEISGTMSGGGSRPMKGRMGTSAVQDTMSAEDLRAMEAELAQAQQERDDLLARKAHLEETIGRAETELEQRRHDLQRWTKEIEAMEKQIVALGPQIKAQEGKYENAKCDPDKVKQLTIVLEQNQKDFAEAERQTNKSKARVQELHERIMEIGGSKLKSAQKKLDEVNLQMSKLTEEITKKTVAIKSSQKNGKKAEENAVKLEAEIVQIRESLDVLKARISAAEKTGMEINELKTLTEQEKSECEAELKKIHKELKKLRSRKAELEEKRLDIQNEIEQIERNVMNVKQDLKSWKDKLQKIKQMEMEDVVVKPFLTLTIEELNAVDIDDVEREIEGVEHQLGGQKPNFGVIQQYKEKEELYLQRVDELESITKDRDEMRKCYDELRKRRFEEFMKGFTIISQKLKETYQMVTLGGDADLELVNSLDPFSDGILFSVRPPRKSWKNISNLSGGEKTLSSLSLVFALHYYKPTPFYVMDEIDAALDFRNVAIVAHYIKEQTKNAQFIVVSLRENMFEQANRLVGVYKTHDTSHSTCIDINSFAEPQPANNELS